MAVVKRKRGEDGFGSASELPNSEVYELGVGATVSTAEVSSEGPSGAAIPSVFTPAQVATKTTTDDTQVGEIQGLFWALLARAGYEVW